MDDLDNIFDTRKPTASRPLLGMTILVVEDSRYTCEALRLMCLRSGARIRRADCLSAASRHLKVYRPSAVIIDLGLPDGRGEELIKDLSCAKPRIGVILGMSGDENVQARAFDAGADGFLAKPIRSIAAFQETILSVLPPEQQQSGPRGVSEEQVDPDISAYRDDIYHISEILGSRQDKPTLDYVAQFLAGVARSAQDTQLADAAGELSRRVHGPGSPKAQASHIMELMNERLQRRVAI
jgi:DNA-binding NarL/FixJ family response regulator